MFDIENLKTKLRERVESAETTKISKVIALLPSIESSLSGLTHYEIWEELTKNGFECTFDTYKTMLARARKQREKAKATSGTVRTATPEPPPQSLASSAQPGEQENLLGDGLQELSQKERREKIADQFITSESSNPLLKRLKRSQQ